LDALVEVSRRVGEARLAVAEDFDEYGVLWAVVSVSKGQAEVLHRRWLLNADPDDPDDVARAIEDNDGDPRVNDVAGAAAASAAARLFDGDPIAMEQAEEESVGAWEEMGIIGGPFPWWDALELPWPEE
jgi:hypothetical protein